MTTTYQIHTGAEDIFYTLWAKHEGRKFSFNGEVQYVGVTRFIQNLAKTKDAAIEKAREITGQTIEPSALKGDEDKRFGPKSDVLRFGKFSGKSVFDLLDTEAGISYLEWVAASYRPESKRNLITVELICKILDIPFEIEMKRPCSDIVVKFGKYRGLSLSQIDEDKDDRNYIQWLADKAFSGFIRKAAMGYLRG